VRRTLLLTALLAAGGAAAWHFSRPAPEARAVTVSQVIGTYKLKLKGDGWLRGTSTPYRQERFGGGAVLVLSRAQPDDGRVHVEIRNAPELNGGLLDLATLEPDFSGDGRLVGDSSIAIVAAGSSTYVNTLTLTFQKDGAKCSGHWSVVWPADGDSGPAGAFDVSLTGRRLPPPKGVGGKRFDDK
jgi:hypothetical protein